MSAIITVNYNGETFDVEVFHDGHIEFPDRDLQSEQAMEEFYKYDSAVLQFRKEWERDPISLIAEAMWVVDEPFVLFMTDCAEHTLPILAKNNIELSGVRRDLEIVRKVASAGVDAPEDQLLMQELFVLSSAIDAMAGSLAGRDRESASAMWAIAEVADVKQPVWRQNNPAEWGQYELCTYAADNAVRAVEFHAPYPKHKAHKAREILWQVRRFVDVMEALGRGKPWPPFKRTR
jgi:hypothetical protein